MAGSEDTCKLLGTSAQTDYEIVWQVYEDATACSKGTHDGEKGWREQAWTPWTVVEVE